MKADKIGIIGAGNCVGSSTVRQAIRENKMAKVFDMIGCAKFCIGSDSDLREWGNSDRKIREIKINSIKNTLEFHKEGIEIYKLLMSEEID